MNIDDKVLLVDLEYKMMMLMNVVEIDNIDRNSDEDYESIRLVHSNKFDMIDNHVYVYNNVHRHLDDVLNRHDVDVMLVLELMMNVNVHD